MLMMVHASELCLEEISDYLPFPLDILLVDPVVKSFVESVSSAFTLVTGSFYPGKVTRLAYNISV